MLISNDLFITLSLASAMEYDGHFCGFLIESKVIPRYDSKGNPISDIVRRNAQRDLRNALVEKIQRYKKEGYRQMGKVF